MDQYGDIDTKPLQHPSQWIRSTDLSEWTDELAGKTYGVAHVPQDPTQPQPVNAIWGIECDTDPDANTHWRSSYTYPVQLTNWALASAPEHPILQYFLDRIPEKAAEARHRAAHTPGVGLSELHYDPVTRTGPVAVTQATSWFLEEHDGLRWNALTGLKDGGKNKVVGDVLILPITGFRYALSLTVSLCWRTFTDTALHQPNNKKIQQKRERGLGPSRCQTCPYSHGLMAPHQLHSGIWKVLPLRLWTVQGLAEDVVMRVSA